MSATPAFANRLAKNLRHLRRWAKREGVSCYRVYDRDLPEAPITLDLYEQRAVLNDFRRDAGDALIAQAAAGLGLAPDDVFLKRRERMAGRRETGKQYGRVDDAAVWLEVGEGGHRFLVNLSDYIDTGLFLDHRITRARVGAEAAGKRVLNLFCYTGSFSVYAAGGGAASSLSIDLSNTYLDWAGENFKRNRVDRRRHTLEQGDVRAALADLAGGRERFDLAIVDPPTFSVSKRMQGTFDIQRDHPALLAAVAPVMAPGGVIWFSTNQRTFRLEVPARYAPRWAVDDQTKATIPPDFHDEKIHQAWRIVT